MTLLTPLCHPPAARSLPMRRLVCLLAVAPLLVPAPARAEEPLVQKVRVALDKGIVYLKDKQRDEGSGRWTWENDALSVLQKGGSSCLAMLALLTAGVPADDQAVRNGLPF